MCFVGHCCLMLIVVVCCLVCVVCWRLSFACVVAMFLFCLSVVACLSLPGGCFRLFVSRCRLSFMMVA